MVRDRLKEFREISKRQSTADEDVVTISFDGNDDQKVLMESLDKIGPLYTQLKQMMESVHDLRTMVHEHDNRHKVEDKVNSIKAQARKLRMSLQEIKARSEKTTGVTHHVTKTHHVALVIHLTQVLHELSVMQADTHDRHAQYVRKELIITGQAGIDENELESLLEESTEIFTQNIIQETQVARQQLHDLQERHDAFIKLEKSITELYQLFQEVALLVQEQGETINRIENNIFEAQTKTEKAKVELVSARINQTKAMKKKFIIALIVGVILLIVALILIFSFTG
ncbi:syntaxin-4-like [Homarus americanus]|uniref:syntaxin-4-like n=1 Tax=Homarus americanus TaxID=6706 RepID=UPI001C48659E|nr:syntaxin-4-like [Homarus americanus]XP_042211098.1 syntaxin-4-like [Homarus americanus]XP_042211099.1 syntaxin-4-like [Homarus americanus]